MRNCVETSLDGARTSACVTCGHVILATHVFRGHHRKVRLLFGLSDAILIASAFLLAYQARIALGVYAVPFEHDFFLLAPVRALLVGWSLAAWIGLGIWWQIYDRIDAAHPRVILGNAFRQCLFGVVSVVLLDSRSSWT